MNSDGAFDPIIGSGGWGFIIRDDRGMMILVGAGREAALLDAFHVELFGCLAGLKAAAQLGLHKIVMEVDASLIKDAVEGDNYRLSAMDGVITVLRLILLSEFVEAKVEVCPRICNRVADALAAYGCKYPSGDLVTWESIPHFVEGLVTIDLAKSNE
jgi:ribonuclease HI